MEIFVFVSVEGTSFYLILLEEKYPLESFFVLFVYSIVKVNRDHSTKFLSHKDIHPSAEAL